MTPSPTSPNAWPGDVLLALVGRAVARLQPAGPPPARDALDRTGILVDPGARPRTLLRTRDLLFADYESPAHTLWRAQELSLFLRHRGLIERPLLDFGCGDGSFASALYDEIDVGVDLDPDALRIARSLNLYGSLLTSPAQSPPVRTVIANSVMEHLDDPDGVLRDVARVLSPGGRFVATITLADFAAHVTRWFGRAESDRLNAQYCHRTLESAEAWLARLRRAGFDIELARRYQPPRFTFWYWTARALGPRALGRVIRRPTRFLAPMMARCVRRSIRPTPDGANLFVVARRP